MRDDICWLLPERFANVCVENQLLSLLERRDWNLMGHLSMIEPSTRIEIRRSTDEDWQQILDLYNSLSEDDLEFRFMNLHHLTIDEAKRISQHKTHTAYVALKDGIVIGEAALEEDGEVSIVVAKEYREEGVGVLLLRRLVEIAKLSELKRLKFFCSPSNTQMASLGAFLGFKLSKHFGMEDEWVLDL
jgi:N-acetylglutamate synthase-like GNAT family acetyltransferase